MNFLAQVQFLGRILILILNLLLTIWSLVTALNLRIEDTPVVKHKHDFKTSRKVMHCSGKVMSDRKSEVQLDQALINQSILSQLDAIGKRLSAIESSASVTSLKVKKNLCAVGLLRVQVSLVPLMRATCMQTYPFYTQLDMVNWFRSRLRTVLGSCLILTKKKGTDPKIKSQWGGFVDIYVKEKVKWPHEYVLAGNTKDRVTYNQLNITQFMAGFC